MAQNKCDTHAFISLAGVALADDSASNDDGTEESNGSIFRTVLVSGWSHVRNVRT